MSSFERLHAALRYHMLNTLGWTELRPAQQEAIDPILSGENALLLAPTAGGKTEAAFLPMVSKAATEGWRGTSILYVCPLKALLNNIAPRLERYASFAGFRARLWHGDINAGARRALLADPPEVLLTTPESLEAILISAKTDHARFLGDVRAVIVDELHAFAGDDRGWHLRFILARLEHLARRPIQRIGLSATVGNPRVLLDWLTAGRPGRVVGPARPPSDGQVTVDYVGSLPNAVVVISRLYRGERRLVFADSRARVESIASGLREAGIRTFVSHASLSLDERRQAEAAFASEPDCVIVATSTLELGLDVGDLDRVIQVGSPGSVASFLQRMGRSGRRPGTQRNCLFLATNDNELLTALAITDLWREGVVENIEPPALPAHIFAQQVMALCLQERGVSRGAIRNWLSASADDVPAATQEAIIERMLSNGVLFEEQGVLAFGPLGEKVFGRRHFSDLVAAFSSPLLLTVRFGRTELGSVHPTSLTRRNGAPPILLLGGRSWKVTEVDWPRRLVAVAPAEGGGKSRWLGAGRMLPASICDAQARVLCGAAVSAELSSRAATRLAALRDTFSFLETGNVTLVADGHGLITLWLFAGGAVSASIAAAFSSKGIAVAEWDDVSVVVRSHSFEFIANSLELIDPEEARPALPDDLADELKFGTCLPMAVLDEVLARRSSDPKTLSALLQRAVRQIFVQG